MSCRPIGSWIVYRSGVFRFEESAESAYLNAHVSRVYCFAENVGLVIDSSDVGPTVYPVSKNLGQ